MTAYPAIAAPKRRALAGAALAALALSLAAAAPVAAAAAGDPAYRQLLTREGIEVELTIDPLAAPGTPLTEDDSVRVRFRVTDGHTGQPLSSLYPAGWLDLLEARAETSSEDCRTRVGSFIGGGFLARAELDLNAYYVLALNQDPSISVVDPLFGFGGSKLLTTVELPGPGGDWALSADGERLFVTLPDHDRVAVVETASWQVATTVPTGPGPVRIAAQPDGAYLWIGWSEGAGETARGGVTVVSATAMKAVAEFATGAGPHDLAFSDDGRYAYVTNRGAGTVSVIDVPGLAVAATVATGPAPVAVAYSPLAGAAFVADEIAGTVSVIEGAGPEPAARIAVAPGLGRLRFAPDGRLGFVPVPAGDAVYVLDAATRRVVHNAQVEPGPVEIGFSDELAYVSHQGSDTVLMIPLAAIGREGEPVPVIDFPGGNNPPGKTPAPTPAAGIVQAPGAPAVLVANPLDRSIYYYKEGMAAPMGHFSNYGRVPRAVMVVDRSLREVEPGVYETAVRLRRPGPYDLAFFLDAPRFIHCFEVDIAADPDLAARRAGRRAVARPLGGPRPAAVGEPVELAFRVADSESGDPIIGLGDVRVLTMATASNWHRRQPAEEVEPGVYRVRFAPETAGLYYAFVEVPSLGIDSNQAPYLAVRAHAAGERAAAATQTEPESETVAAAGEAGGEPRRE